jgi:hypothetical protein
MSKVGVYFYLRSSGTEGNTLGLALVIISVELGLVSPLLLQVRHSFVSKD